MPRSLATGRTTVSSRSTVANRFITRNFGSGLRFSGTAGGGVVMTSLMTAPAAFTVTGWFKRTRRGVNEMLIGHNTSNAKIGFVGNNWFVRIINGGGSDSAMAAPLADGWHFFALTRDSSNIVKISVDGQASQALFSSAAQSGDWPVSRVARSEVDQNFLGDMDEVRIWAVALSDSQIADLYYRGTVPQTGLFLEYLFNEGSGTTATDTSATGNNGTISSASYISTGLPTMLRSTAS